MIPSIIFVILLCSQILSDWSVIRFKESPTEENSTIWHIVKGFEIFLYIGIISYLLTICSEVSGWKMVLYLLMYTSLRLAFFDILLNIVRGLPWNHIGNSEVDNITAYIWLPTKIIGLCSYLIFLFLDYNWLFVEIFLKL